jgi:hypothetical protein
MGLRSPNTDSLGANKDLIRKCKSTDSIEHSLR